MTGNNRTAGAPTGWSDRGISILNGLVGYTPFAVRYNTGMPVAESGAALNLHLAALVDAYPCAIDAIVLVGHSMGGLVILAACEQGGDDN